MGDQKFSTVGDLRLFLKEIGQEHLLGFFDQLTDDEKQSLCHQIELFQPLDKICLDYKKAVANSSLIPEDDRKIHAVPDKFYASSVSTDSKKLKHFWSRGLEAIAKNHVGVILLAGGQGSRLGVSYPKGMYDVGLPSKKSLFQLQAERILRLQSLAAVSHKNSKPTISWFIMTSESTKKMTIRFFEENSFFGLEKEQIFFFEQGLMPCFDFEAKILLESKHRLAAAPDGNGGLYKALVHSGCLKIAEEKGLKYFHVYCVDNILVRVADPVFIGYCLENNADCGNKVIEKKRPGEPLGVVCKIDNLGFCVMEYSEIPAELSMQKEASGKLLYKAANIANHFFTLEFLKDICSNHLDDLVYHVAKKKISFLNEKGQLCKPIRPNGVKLEKFVFDVFPFAKNFFVWQVERQDEFSPLKNAEGPDSPATCCVDLFRLHGRWLSAGKNKVIRKNGGENYENDVQIVENVEKIELTDRNSDSDLHQEGRKAPPSTPIECEISPLTTYGEEDLENLIRRSIEKQLLNVKY